MTKTGMLTLTVLALTFGLGTATGAGDARAKPRITPTCLRAARNADACGLVEDFFDALDRGRLEHACSVLGERLRRETGGSWCKSFLAPSRGAPHTIVGAHRTRAGVVVLVDVGLHELDHYRVLRWAALVGYELGDLRILETRQI